MKKILLGLGSIATIATPVAVVVSCGKPTVAPGKLGEDNTQNYGIKIMKVKEGDLKITQETGSKDNMQGVEITEYYAPKGAKSIVVQKSISKDFTIKTGILTAADGSTITPQTSKFKLDGKPVSGFTISTTKVGEFEMTWNDYPTLNYYFENKEGIGVALSGIFQLKKLVSTKAETTKLINKIVSNIGLVVASVEIVPASGTTPTHIGSLKLAKQADLTALENAMKLFANVKIGGLTSSTTPVADKSAVAIADKTALEAALKTLGTSGEVTGVTVAGIPDTFPTDYTVKVEFKAKAATMAGYAKITVEKDGLMKSQQIDIVIPA